MIVSKSRGTNELTCRGATGLESLIWRNICAGSLLATGGRSVAYAEQYAHSSEIEIVALADPNAAKRKARLPLSSLASIRTRQRACGTPARCTASIAVSI